MLSGKTIHGFEFKSSREVPEINARIHEAVYTKNGAKLLFIEREDSNKSFAISFKTIPYDDTGVFHILEHSVLCGSEKYPVKEPFVELLKGSLKTFLNAFTFPDKTMYPVSSRNDKDFLNLVDIYMDAVLHPLAVKKPEIFYQEGWHYELTSKDAPMTYKGVVLNEMKGAYSSADEVEMSAMSSMLYENSCYARDSGGNPASIPELSYEEFVSAHEKFYHPSNARIVLDGSVDLEKTLLLLDGFLSEYDYKPTDFVIDRITPQGRTEKTIAYEIAENEDPEGKARVCLGFATADFSDRKKLYAMGILADAICGTNDSPFKKKMLDSGLCEDVSFVSYDGIQQNSVIIEIKNVKEENLDAAEKLCFKSLAALVRGGIDKEALRASHNNLEFRLREQDMATFPAGIAYAISAHDVWLYGGDPITSLSFEEDLKALAGEIDGDYYERLVESMFLKSKHSAVLYMLPSTTLGEQKRSFELEALEKIKGDMSEEQIEQLVALNKQLENWQKTPDSKEALDTIPKLLVSDISEIPEKYPSVEYSIDARPALFTESASRGITYASLLFDVSDFNTDELFAVSLITELVKNLPTERMDALTFQTKAKSELGSLSLGTLVASRRGVVTPYVQVSVSCLDSKRESAVQIIEEMLLHTKYDDLSAIETVIRQLKIQSAEAIAAAGHSAAFSRASAYVSREAAVAEHLDGIENYLKLKSLDEKFEEYKEALSDSLAEISKKIFTKARVTLCHSGARCDSFMENLLSILPDGCEFERGSKIEVLKTKNEGLLIPAGVAYAAMAADITRNCSKIPGAIGVVRSILSYGYLWNTIRVQGGAYGAGFIKRNSGVAGYYTYRDPDAKRSVDIFLDSPKYLRELAKSGEDITGFIIGAIGDSEPLLTPKVLSALSIAAYLRGESYDDRLRFRREMIDTNADSLVEMAELIEKASSLGGFCVVGGRDKLEAFGDKISRTIEI